MQLATINDPQSALATLREALTIRQRLADNAPEDDVRLKHLGDTYFNLGVIHHKHLRELDNAMASYAKAREIHERLVGEKPNVIRLSIRPGQRTS